MENSVSLEKTVRADLESLFQIQQDEAGIHLAAFTPKDGGDREAYFQKFEKILNDPTIRMRSAWMNGSIIGSIARFYIGEEAEITYWIDRKHWGKGIATEVLKKFLEMETVRPLRGRVAFDNFGSQKVLQKNGFIQVGRDSGFANARGMEIEEYIFLLGEGKGEKNE